MGPLSHALVFDPTNDDRCTDTFLPGSQIEPTDADFS